MDTKSGKIQPQRMPDLVLEQLMEWIMDGKLHMGQRLNTEELAQSLGVSRMPVREALKNLEKLGIVESVPYVGARLVTLSKSDIRQIYMIRQALEPLLGYYACLNATQEKIEEVCRCQDSFERLMREGSPTAKEVFTHNRDFHFAIYTAANMERILYIVSMLWDNLAFCKLIFGQTYVTSAEAAQRMIQDHRNYLDALISRDAALLQQLLTSNLKHVAIEVPEKISRYLEEGEDPV